MCSAAQPFKLTETPRIWSSNFAEQAHANKEELEATQGAAIIDVDLDNEEDDNENDEEDEEADEDESKDAAVEEGNGNSEEIEADEDEDEAEAEAGDEEEDAGVEGDCDWSDVANVFGFSVGSSVARVEIGRGPVLGTIVELRRDFGVRYGGAVVAVVDEHTEAWLQPMILEEEGKDDDDHCDDAVAKMEEQGGVNHHCDDDESSSSGMDPAVRPLKRAKPLESSEDDAAPSPTVVAAAAAAAAAAAPSVAPQEVLRRREVVGVSAIREEAHLAASLGPRGNSRQIKGFGSKIDVGHSRTNHSSDLFTSLH